MAARKPIVIIGGDTKQLASSDQVPSSAIAGVALLLAHNSFWTG